MTAYLCLVRLSGSAYEKTHTRLNYVFNSLIISYGLHSGRLNSNIVKRVVPRSQYSQRKYVHNASHKACPQRLTTPVTLCQCAWPGFTSLLFIYFDQYQRSLLFMNITIITRCKSMVFFYCQKNILYLKGPKKDTTLKKRFLRFYKKISGLFFFEIKICQIFQENLRYLFSKTRYLIFPWKIWEIFF